MHELYLALMAVGLLVLTISLLSVPIERITLLSKPILGLGLGVAVGPLGAGWLDAARWTAEPTRVLEAAAKLTMAVALMGVALRLTPRYFARRRRTMTLLLGAIMPLMWIATSLGAAWILGLPLWTGLLAGAVLTPTDPVLATTIVQGKVAEDNLPKRIRNALSAESGANDGLVLPLVLLPILVLTKPPHEAAFEWVALGIVWETGGAIALGLALGYGVGRALCRLEKRGTMEKTSFLATTLALTLFVLGAGEILSVNGVLAVFVAGVGFDHAVSARDRAEEENVQETVNQFFTPPFFALLGLFLPVHEWLALGWKAAAVVAFVLVLRRLPFALLLARWTPGLHGAKDAFMVGWFGPIGVAAIYYALMAEQRTGIREIWVIATLVVTASVVVHGVTAAPATRWYARRSRPSAEPRGGVAAPATAS